MSQSSSETPPTASDTLPSKRIFLFLQGPNGRFFSSLASELRKLGHECRRVNLCPADWLFWRGRDSDNFRDGSQHWRAYIRQYLQVHQVTDIILNGGRRSYHEIAREEARKQHVQIYATDFGYLRTDWIAFEKNGMSGDSLLTRDPEEIHALARKIPHCDFSKKYVQRFRHMAAAEVMGNAADILFGWMFPGYQSYHLYHPLQTGYGSIRRKVAARFFRSHANTLIQRRLEESDMRPLFLFPMQLESDSQIRFYSSFSNMREPLELIIHSFAKHAPASAKLLIKVHPLDPGVVGWRRTVKQIVADTGMTDRIDYIDVGLLDEIIRACRGIVTINSTVGIIGLRFQKNVKVLGQAIYDIPGITFQGDLDDFWQTSNLLDLELRQSYLKVLAGCLHVRGFYYSNPGMRAAAQGIAFRLHTNSVNAPLDPDSSSWLNHSKMGPALSGQEKHG